MYAIKEKTKQLNQVKTKTYCRNVKFSNAEFEVEAGTTGFRGDVPREKSARGYVSLLGKNGDFFFRPVSDESGRPVGIGIACCGDGALMTLTDSLIFAVNALTDFYS